MARKKRDTKRPIESYDHRDKQRVNNPPVGLVTPQTDPDAGQKKKRYAYDPHLDPQLLWAGKAEHTSFEAPTVSLHVHERIEPRTIIETVRKRNGNGRAAQLPLFEVERQDPLREAIEFYQHAHGWTNRLIAGDSLLVMNSLLEKEGMAGKAQMIYIDPPYGIKYGSNFQPFVNKRDVKDGKDEDLTAEPEQIRAFRDTWELGIHSYLTYLRDRLLLARELLTESGSIFVQISDENVHRVRCLMDEVFGAGNFVSLITFKKSGSQTAAAVPTVGDYLVWYCKDKPYLKFRPLYKAKQIGLESAEFRQLLLPDGTYRMLTSEELIGQVDLPNSARVFKSTDLHSRSGSESTTRPYEFQGKTYRPRANAGWRTTPEGLMKLENAGRLLASGNSLRYVHFFDDFSYSGVTSIWDDVMGEANIVYVVQTNQKVIERCLLMTTDPGDLVFDPTCVRKGTGVWVCPSPALPARGEGDGISPRVRGDDRGAILRPIETIQPGNYVLAHDGLPHRVVRTIRRMYQEVMIGIRHNLTSQTLWLTADHRVLAHRRPHSLGGHSDWSGIPHALRGRSRVLRKEMTPPERTLWQVLRGNGIGLTFRRQHPIGPYIADFYCREAALVVEVDGAMTHSDPAAIEHDRVRDEFMHRLNLKVLRVPAAEVARNLEGVCTAIAEACKEQQSPEYAQWIESKEIVKGDILFYGPDRIPVRVAEVVRQFSEEEVYDLEIQDAHSFITEVCVVHNCGSGTTAYVAEQWGRRWITCDTSRVALTLARQRLMTAVFDYYELAHPQEGVGSGFKYKTVPHVTLKSIANNPDIREGMTREEIDAAIARHADQETLYDQPFVDRKKTRVSGPFTVEAVPAPAVKSPDEILEQKPQPADTSIARSGETLRQGEWRDELLRAGIRGKAGQHIRFARLEPLPGCRWLHADGETRPSDEGADRVREGGAASDVQRIVVSFGPEHAPLEQRQVERAWEEAQQLNPKPKLLVFAAFQFDPEAAKDIDEMKPELAGMQFLKVQMNADLLTDDLKKKRASNESFWLIGQPDIQVERIAKGENKGKYRVSVHGFDYYNTKTGGVESGGEDRIAVWLLDTDYDGRSLYPRQVFFPMAGDSEGWARLAKNLKAEIDEERIEAYRGTVSLPFEPGEHRRIAVKIVDDRGIESLKVMDLPE